MLFFPLRRYTPRSSPDRTSTTRTPFRIPRVCIDREAGGIGTSLTREPVLSQYGSKSVSPPNGIVERIIPAERDVRSVERLANSVERIVKVGILSEPGVTF